MKKYNAPCAELHKINTADIITESSGFSDPIAEGGFETVKNALDSWWY